MIVSWLFFAAVNAQSWNFEEVLTTESMKNKDEFDQLAEFGDAQHRGNKWYDQDSSKDVYESDFKTMSETSSSVGSSSISDTSTSEVSSAETKERKIPFLAYRSCIPCPQDMLKSYRNVGIKWICGSYQRARRTFKSDCMMKYRNCQDGTLFVKISDHRCQNDTFHGKHWFYVYKTE